MNILIDGYNLIRSDPDLRIAEAKGEGVSALLYALRLYRKAKGHRLTLVLDAGPQPEESRANLEGIPVIYAGHGQSADDVLARLAARHGAGATVITNDRELKARCRARGAEVVGAGEFAEKLLEAALTQGGGPFEEEEEGWDFTTRKKGPSRRLPKARRKSKRRKDRL